MIFTLSPAASSSCAAWIAPAWMLFQNSWVVPFGTTASVYVLCPPADAVPESCFFEAESLQAAAPSSTNRTAAESRGVLNEGLQRVEVRVGARRSGRIYRRVRRSSRARARRRPSHTRAGDGRRRTPRAPTPATDSGA